MRSIVAGSAIGATSAGATAGAAAGVAVKATSIGLGLKLLGVAALALVVGAGVLLQRTNSQEPAAIPAAPANNVPASVNTANAAPAAVEPANTAPAKATLPDPAAPARPSEAAPIEKSRAVPAPSSPRLVAREPVASAEETAVAPAPVVAGAAVPEEDPLAAETRRLRDAHGALRAGDAPKALALLGEQGGQLGEERAAARVLALCQLGRVAESEAARAAFLREHPRSPLADRVRGGCAPSIAK